MKLKQSEIREILSIDSVDDKKSKIQDFIIERFRFNPRGYVTVPTGVGKTYLASTIIKKVNARNPDYKINIVVPSHLIKEIFERYIKEWNLLNTTIYIINSYTKNEIVHACDLLIIDELHKAAGKGKKFTRTIPITTTKFVLGLSATISKAQHLFLKSLGLSHFFDMEIDEARLIGVIPDYQKFNIGVELPESSKLSYVSHQEVYRHHIDTFSQITLQPEKFLFSLIGGQSQVNKVNLKYACDSFHLEEGVIYSYAKAWRKAMIERNAVLITNPNIYKEVLKLCRYLNEKEGKVIVFCKSQEICEQLHCDLNKEYRSNYYHSGLSKKLRTQYLDQFIESGKFLCVVDAVDEGVDLPAITYGINYGYNSSDRKNVQRTGRCIRADKNNPDKEAMFFSFYSKDFELQDQVWKSQQLVWLNNAQYGQSNIQWKDSVEECFEVSINRLI